MQRNGKVAFAWRSVNEGPGAAMAALRRAASDAGRLMGLAALLVMASLFAPHVAAQTSPSFSMAFVPPTIASGGTAKFVITVSSGGPQAINQFNVSTGQLVGPLMVVPNSGATDCPDPKPFAYGPNSFAFVTGGNAVLGPDARCTISVDVTATVASNATLTQPPISFTYFSCDVDSGGGGPFALVGPASFSCGSIPELMHGSSATLAVIVASPPAITSPLPPDGATGQPYSHQVTVTGTAPVSVTATGLPPGLVFDPTTLRVSGVPTVPGTYSGSFTASNGVKPDAVQRFSIVIGAPPIITSPPPGPGTVAVPYFHQVSVTGTPPIDVTVTGLPPGLVFSASTLQITGTPTLAGSYPGTITAINAYRPNAVQTYTIGIAGTVAPLSITTTSPLPDAMIGTAYSTSFAATGGKPPYSWSFAGGAPPPGLTLGGNGVLSGAPTASGSFTFDVRVTDSVGTSASKPFTLVVASSGVIIVSQNPLSPPLALNAAFSLQLVAAGGAPPYQWGILSGALPTGLSLGFNGVISGSPSVPGTYGFTVQVIDAANSTASRAFTLDVAVAPLSIVTPAPLSPTLPLGGALSIDLQAQGGAPPYTWKLASGNLPPGLALSSAGHLAGNATTPGTYNFEVSVTDTLGATATRAYSLTVDKAAATVTLDVNPDPAVFGLPVTATITVRGLAKAPTGTVEIWMAGTNQACPSFTIDLPLPPGTALAPRRDAALDASGRAQFVYSNLPIDDYRVCALYQGDSTYAASAPPDKMLYVIKGVLLPPPQVTLAVPAQVPPGSLVIAQVAVTPIGTTQIPQGNVQLRGIDGSATQATLDRGAAEVAFIAPAAGTLALSIDYAGDGAFPAASSAPIAVAIAPDPAIPALSPAALLVLGALIAALALHRLRRRPR